MTTTGSATATPAGLDREAVITGDAVLLDLRTASFAARMLAALIDGALQLGVLVLGTLAVSVAAARADLDDGLVAAAIVTVSVLAYVGYPVLSELLLRGRSVGRLAMGTRVVRDDGGPVHLRQSLLRAVMAMLEIWSTVGSLALASSVIDRRSRRLGDLLAGTVVIQERMRDLEPDRVEVPEVLISWADTADVGRLPLTLMQDIRSFLPRSESIHPASRRQISRDLLHRTLPHVAPAPPPGTDPEAFLTAVVAERSRRDETRLRRAQDRQVELSAEVRAVPFSG